jgi:CheY-like chemotaxis protein
MVPESRARPLIAVVNDDTAFLALMRELLTEEAPYDVVTCTEGDQVYAFIKEQRPDLVILDLVMNREERGWQALELLKLDPATRRIPVILCSAAGRSLQQQASLLEKYGVEALPKPFDLDDLLSKIREMLTRYPPQG